jgi:hypothetical protein
MNKKYLSIYLLGVSVFLFAAISCKKNNLVVDNDVTPPPFAKFNSSTTSGTYYIKSTEEPFKIPVGVTTVSNADRVINFSYASPTGAASGTQYNAPASLTIPAGEALDSLSIQGLFAGYPVSSRIDTLKITVDGGDVSANSYNATYNLVMRKYCDVILNDIEGDFTTDEYNSNGSYSYGPYVSSATLTQVPNTSTASIVFENFWDSGITATGTIDWTSPANFKVNIPYQYTGIDYDVGQPLYLRSSPSQTNTFSSCDKTYTLTVDFIVENYPTAGSSAYYSQNYRITMHK